jgi:asparagine synthase (glutamine-hydrolysing)
MKNKFNNWVFTNDQTLLDKDYLLSLIYKSVQEKFNTIEMQRSALLLSGGLDSGILAYELSKLGLKETYTVVADENAVDLISAQNLCGSLGLHFNPIIAKEIIPDCAIATTELSNRSIVEEMCCHVVLSNHLRTKGIRVLFTGCGADEIFIGYQHLLRFRNQNTRQHLQEEFINNYHKMDLRAFNKTYMLNAIEIRNPFLSKRLLEYAASLDIENLLIGKHREMKIALRHSYSSILGEITQRPKLIARETMGVKQILLKRNGDSPYIYKKRWIEIFSDDNLILELLNQAQSLQ